MQVKLLKMTELQHHIDFKRASIVRAYSFLWSGWDSDYLTL